MSELLLHGAAGLPGDPPAYTGARGELASQLLASLFPGPRGAHRRELLVKRITIVLDEREFEKWKTLKRVDFHPTNVLMYKKDIIITAKNLRVVEHKD